MPNEAVPPRSTESGKEAEPASGAPLPSAATVQTPATRWSARNRVLAAIAISLLVYLALAYLVMPSYWTRYGRRHPIYEDMPDVTYTADGIRADPINVSLIGTKTEVMRIMLAAKWSPADPLTLRSCLEIAEASVLKRKYDDAPVSNERLFGRKQDLAFELAVGDNPRHRHHVRFWESDKRDDDGRPILDWRRDL